MSHIPDSRGPGTSSGRPIGKKPVSGRQGGLAGGRSDGSEGARVEERRAVFMRDLHVLSELSREGGASNIRDIGNTAGPLKAASHAPQAPPPAELPRSWEAFRAAYFPDALFASLYPHQRDGVRWLYELHGSRHRGGILGDDMGLGKTKQIACTLTALIRASALSRVLIIAPVSVLYNWEKELHDNMDDYLNDDVPLGSDAVRGGSTSTGGSGSSSGRKVRVRIDVMASDVPQKKRVQMLHDAFNNSNSNGSRGSTSITHHHVHIIITSYQLVTNMVDAFCSPSHLTGSSSTSSKHAPNYYWDYVILDEGHLIKNRRTKMAEAMAALPSRHRVMLTGTAIQNNLTEFYYLVQWATTAAASAPLPLTDRDDDDEAGEKEKGARGHDSRGVMNSSSGHGGGRHAIMLTQAPLTTMTVTTHSSSTSSTTGGANGLLGDLDYFKQRIAAPIEAGQDPKATPAVRQAGAAAAENLMNLVKPVFLHRKKSETIALSSDARGRKATDQTDAIDDNEDGVHGDSIKKSGVPEYEHAALPKKREFTVWIPLSSQQREIYETYLAASRVRQTIESTCSNSSNSNSSSGNDPGSSKNKKGSGRLPVEVVSHLRTLCRHPLLLECSAQSGAAEAEAEDDLVGALGAMKLASDTSADSTSRATVPTKAVNPNSNLFELLGRTAPTEEVYRGSVKLRVLISLCSWLHRRGHRMLVFSQSIRMLDIIQRVLAECGLSSCRIDGRTSRPAGSASSTSTSGGTSISSNGPARQSAAMERHAVASAFNDKYEVDLGDIDGTGVSKKEWIYTGPSICLLTTKACGTGLNLTGADRVIIFDPSWNPAEDRQAVDRAYRIGQHRDVVVYRLIMAAAIEEKMYEKQVFKDGVRVLTESSGDGQGRHRGYFSQQETRELFTLGKPGQSDVMNRLWEQELGRRRSRAQQRNRPSSAVDMDEEDVEDDDRELGALPELDDETKAKQLASKRSSSSTGDDVDMLAAALGTIGFNAPIYTTRIDGVLGYTRHDSLYDAKRSEEAKKVHFPSQAHPQPRGLADASRLSNKPVSDGKDRGGQMSQPPRIEPRPSVLGARPRAPPQPQNKPTEKKQDPVVSTQSGSSNVINLLSDSDDKSVDSSEDGGNSVTDEDDDDSYDGRGRGRCALIDDEAEEVGDSEAEREDVGEEEGEGEWIDRTSSDSSSEEASSQSSASESGGEAAAFLLTEGKDDSSSDGEVVDDLLLDSPEPRPSSRHRADPETGTRSRLKKWGGKVDPNSTNEDTSRGRLQKASARSATRVIDSDSDDALLQTDDAEVAGRKVPAPSSTAHNDNGVSEDTVPEGAILVQSPHPYIPSPPTSNNSIIAVAKSTPQSPDFGTPPSDDIIQGDSFAFEEPTEAPTFDSQSEASVGDQTAGPRDSLQVPASVTRHRGGGRLPIAHNDVSSSELLGDAYIEEEDLSNLLSQFGLDDRSPQVQAKSESNSASSPSSLRKTTFIDLVSPTAPVRQSSPVVSSRADDVTRDSVVGANVAAEANSANSINLEKEFFQAKTRMFETDRQAVSTAKRLSFVSSDDDNSSSANDEVGDVDGADNNSDDDAGGVRFSWTPECCIPEGIQERPYVDILQRPRLRREYNGIIERADRLEATYRKEFGAVFPSSSISGERVGDHEEGEDEEGSVAMQSKLRRLAELYLQALVICDSDAAVHKKLFILGQVLGTIE